MVFVIACLQTFLPGGNLYRQWMAETEKMSHWCGSAEPVSGPGAAWSEVYITISMNARVF